MSIERCIIEKLRESRILEYRCIRLNNGDSVVRRSDGSYFYRYKDPDKSRSISAREYEAYRKNLSDDPIYLDPDFSELDTPVKNDVSDFTHHLNDLRKVFHKYGDEGTRLDTISAFQSAIELMSTHNKEYQDIKGYLSHKERKLINSTIDNNNSNEISNQ